MLDHHKSNDLLWTKGYYAAEHFLTSIHVSGLKNEDVFIHA